MHNNYGVNSNTNNNNSYFIRIIVIVIILVIVIIRTFFNKRGSGMHGCFTVVSVVRFPASMQRLLMQVAQLSEMLQKGINDRDAVRYFLQLSLLTSNSCSFIRSPHLLSFQRGHSLQKFLIFLGWCQLDWH